MKNAKSLNKSAFIAAVIAVSLVIIAAACLLIYGFTGSVPTHKLLPGYSMSGIVVSYVPESDAALYEMGMIVSSDQVSQENHDHNHEEGEICYLEETGMISHVGDIPFTRDEVIASLGVDEATADALGIQDGCVQLSMVVFGAPDGVIEVKIETGTIRPIDRWFR